MLFFTFFSFLNNSYNSGTKEELAFMIGGRPVTTIPPDVTSQVDLTINNQVKARTSVMKLKGKQLEAMCQGHGLHYSISLFFTYIFIVYYDF